MFSGLTPLCTYQYIIPNKIVFTFFVNYIVNSK